MVLDLPFDNSTAEKYLEEQGVLGLLKSGDGAELSACYPDLAVLYHFVRARKPFQVLEFGSGFSTIVLAAACKANWDSYLETCAGNPAYDRPNVVSLETTEQWQKNTEKKVASAGLSDFAKIISSKVSIAEHQGQICHFYDSLPDIVPDFVYLDGPDPAAVEGAINGLSFKNKARTVMSGDILKYESTLLPGFFMIVDGRENNVRFLKRNLTRTYTSERLKGYDQTVFVLDEEKLGRKNIFGSEAYTAKV